MVNILLYSSGVDSYIAYYYLKARDINIQPVYINLNHRYHKIELDYIRKSRPETIILEVPTFYKYEEFNAYIPVRNLLFCLMSTAHFSKINDDLTIYLGGLRDDRISDNTQKAFEKFSEVLSLSVEKNVTVKSAFDFKLSKYEIVQWFVTTFPDKKYDLLENTFSCYHPIETKEDPHCYNCRACFRRNVSLFEIEKLPFDRDLIEKYYKEFQKNKDEYDPVRYDQTIKYCKYIRGIRYE